MSKENSTNNCLFKIEVKGDDVSLSVEGGARNLAETIANVAIESEEINAVLKAAIMMLIQYEMSQESDSEEFQTPVFSNMVGQA